MKWPKGKRLSVLRVTAEALEAMGPEYADCSDLARFGRCFPGGLAFLRKSFVQAHERGLETFAFDAFLTGEGRHRFWVLWKRGVGFCWSEKTTIPPWNFRTFSKLIREGYLSRKGYRLLTARRQKEGE